MEILYENKTTLSSENYWDLVQFHQKKNNLKYWIYTATFSLFFIVLIIFHLTSHHYFYVTMLLACLIAFLAYRFIYPYYKTGKELQSDKVKNSLVNYYFFYDKYFKIKNKLGSSKIKYYKLYKVYENENYFYLYLDKSNAFILDKSGFTIGDVNLFGKFMKSKVWFKF